MPTLLALIQYIAVSSSEVNEWSFNELTSCSKDILVMVSICVLVMLCC